MCLKEILWGIFFYLWRALLYLTWLLVKAGFIVQPCWQHLSVSQTHILLSTCIHYSCSVYLISSIISCQISAARRYCSVSAFSEMYSLLLSVQKLNVPKMTHVASTWGDFYFVSCHSFWSFTSLTKNHVYANMEYKLTFSLYRLKTCWKYQVCITLLFIPFKGRLLWKLIQFTLNVVTLHNL